MVHFLGPQLLGERERQSKQARCLWVTKQKSAGFKSTLEQNPTTRSCQFLPISLTLARPCVCVCGCAWLGDWVRICATACATKQRTPLGMVLQGNQHDRIAIHLAGSIPKASTHSHMSRLTFGTNMVIELNFSKSLTVCGSNAKVPLFPKNVSPKILYQIAKQVIINYNLMKKQRVHLNGQWESAWGAHQLHTPGPGQRLPRCNSAAAGTPERPKVLSAPRCCPYNSLPQILQQETRRQPSNIP